MATFKTIGPSSMGSALHNLTTSPIDRGNGLDSSNMLASEEDAQDVEEESHIPAY
jgi:hypothetical protein